jgi:hypothetical protein
MQEIEFIFSLKAATHVSLHVKDIVVLNID